MISMKKYGEKIVKNKKLAHVSNRLVIGVRGRIQPGINGLQIKLSTNFTFMQKIHIIRRCIELGPTIVIFQNSPKTADNSD